MEIYLIKKDKSYEKFTDVIEWSKEYIVYKAGRGVAKFYAGDNEYFTDQNPEK